MITIAKKVLKVGKIRNAEYYDMVEVFDKLYADSIKGENFLRRIKRTGNHMLNEYSKF